MSEEKITVKVGDKIYIPTKLYISHGEDDVVGGLATVTKVKLDPNNKHVYVEVKENPGTSYSLDRLLEQQEKLKKEFGNKSAYQDPDINTPWIQDGDIVNGKVYHGKDIW